MTDFAAYQQIVATVAAEAAERARWRAVLAPQPKPAPFSMTEADCIAADLHNNRDKAPAAHRAQTLSAVALELKHNQPGVAQ